MFVLFGPSRSQMLVTAFIEDLVEVIQVKWKLLIYQFGSLTCARALYHLIIRIHPSKHSSHIMQRHTVCSHTHRLKGYRCMCIFSLISFSFKVSARSVIMFMCQQLPQINNARSQDQDVLYPRALFRGITIYCGSIHRN